MRRDELPLNPLPSDDRPGDDRMLGAGNPADDSKPALTWTGIRRRITVFTLAGTAAIALVVWWVVPRESLIKPGPLTRSHAQILAGTVSEQRCGSCHPPSSLDSAEGLLSQLLGTGNASGRTQSDLCLDCHRDQIADSLALAAHNLPLSARTALTRAALSESGDEGNRPTFRLEHASPAFSGDPNSLQCATCHREHHGPDHQLSRLSDAQCQTCHTQQFGSFASSHPEWNDWPYGRGGEIRFSHASHMNRHFPGRRGGGEPFDCRSCHPVGDPRRDHSPSIAGEVLRTASYERSCGRCHDESLDAQLASGFDLLALPTLAPETLGATNWPAAATGVADGTVAPLTALLVRENPLLASLIRKLDGADLNRMDWSDAAMRDAGRELAIAVRALIEAIATEGPEAIAAQLARQGIAASPTRQLLRTLPPQLVEVAYREWFGNAPVAQPPTARDSSAAKIRLASAGDTLLLPPESTATPGSLLGDTANENGNAADEDPLLEDPLLEDPLLEDPLLQQPSPNEPLSSTSAVLDSRRVASPQHGGWWIDRNRLAIRYRGQGHADPVMIGIIEMFAQLGDGDPIKAQFFAAAAAQACLDCHKGAGEVPSRWKARARIGRRSEFTKFSHRQHLSVSALGDCVHCHRVDATATHSETVTDFQPLDKQTCAACHTRGGAGDRCTQCHRYHIAN